jgi:acetolactate decarboxylase
LRAEFLKRTDSLVQWVGAQRNVLAGDLSGRIALSTLARLQHLYAVGPLAELRGEISIFDGVPLISRAVDGGIRTDIDFSGEACFLVYAQVDAWREIEMPEPIADEATLQEAIVNIALRMAIDVSRPFPFMIRATPERALFHVLDKRDGLGHNAELHEKAKVRFAIIAQSVEIVGFYSHFHRGVFTPLNSNFHMHVRTLDNALSGHLDVIRSVQNARLYLPAKEK